MLSEEVSERWARQFGLALDPLFGSEASSPHGEHHVLLDGGVGSFALSISDEQLWGKAPTAAWAWSSDLPHHVTVTSAAVEVTRWDRSSPQMWARQSVEAQLDSF